MSNRIGTSTQLERRTAQQQRHVKAGWARAKARRKKLLKEFGPGIANQPLTDTAPRLVRKSAGDAGATAEPVRADA